MSKLISILTFCCLVAIGYGQDPSLQDLINKIFTSTTPIPGIDPSGPTIINPTPTPFEPTPTKTTVLSPEPAEGYKSCGLDKQCVPRFLCNEDGISDNGVGLIDIRIDGVACGYLEKCCEISSKTTEPIIKPVPEEQHVGCGFRNPSGVGFRITGDAQGEAQFAEFPWMVALLRDEKVGDEILNIYECGGAVIAPTVVLTATHCVHLLKADTLVVRAGEWDTQTKSEVLPHQDQRVKEIIVHEKYHKGALYNDVALLILENGFVWQENVRPICLPEMNVNFDYSRCYATGWGKNTFGKDGAYQEILKKIELPIMPNDQCQKNLRTTRLGKHFILDPSFICAGGEKGKDTCKGDGGSPLVCPIPGVKDRFYQAGIVAWGIGCGEQNIPGVYANVPYLRQWISDKLSARGIDFTHFTP